jgi:hypothetical protein
MTTILRPGFLLAACGAACLIAFAPEGRRPPAEAPAIDQSALSSTGARVEARLSATVEPIDKIVPSAAPIAAIRPEPRDAAVSDAAPPRVVGLSSACCAPAESAPRPAPPEQVAPSDADLAAQFAYADVPGPPAVGALSAIVPTAPATAPTSGLGPPPAKNSRTFAGASGCAASSASCRSRIQSRLGQAG